jgi:glycosyltransferase involved in cell wall biosynthesis
MLRVLVTIFEQLIPISGGGTPRISSIINILTKKGHEVSVAASLATDVEKALKILNCDDVLTLKNIDRLDRKKINKYLFFHPLNISKIVSGATKLKPDMIIAHNSIAGLAALLARKVVHSLVVVDMTDLIFEYLSSYDTHAWAFQLQRIGEKLEKKVIRESDKIITISDALRGTLIRKGAMPNRVDVVYDGVNIDVFRPHMNEAKRLRKKYGDGVENVVMYHGVIDPQDHPEIIVDAAEHVTKEHPDTMFWIIGDGAAIPGIKEKIRRKKLEKHFFLSGWVPFEKVPTFISACDLGFVILPDITSARIRVTLKGFEYWACEKPIVVSDLPALREIVSPWETGLFYKPGDPKDLAEKTCILLDDKRMSRKMGKSGRKLVETKYSWEKLATEFVTICENMF